ncbi:MAG: GNAT family N-acetyltransferase [Acidobacteria bacterium]|nr:GNAT family N-acetyltransferase [Acidobacteriota bacterium]
MLILETARLILRPFDENDVDQVFAMRSDADVMRYIRPVQTTRAEAESWIGLVSSRWATDKIGFCAVVEKASGRFVGWCGLWRLKETGETEVGYALRREFRGRGYALEAAGAFLKYGFETLGLDEIVAVARPENRASWRVMERLGMTYDYTGRFYESELVHYSISQGDFGFRIPDSGLD